MNHISYTIATGNLVVNAIRNIEKLLTPKVTELDPQFLSHQQFPLILDTECRQHQ